MANTFSEEEKRAFDKIFSGFEDACALSNNISIYSTKARSNDTIWHPQPYGTTDVKQLSPSSLDQSKCASWKLNAKEMHDEQQEARLQKAATALSSDINTAVRDCVSLQGTLVSTIIGAAGDYDDIATCSSLMNEVGIPNENRYLGITSRDYNGLAGNLPNRQTLETKALTAYEKSRIGDVAGFDTFKLDAGKQLAANAATITIATNGDQVRYVPLSSESTVARNRYQTVTVSTTTGVAVGDAFTIAGINSVHMVSKENTGQLKTFRVISVDTGTTMTISPAIIGANGASPTAPEISYKNKNAEVVTTSATSATAAITFLNKTATAANPFWYKDSIELRAGRYNVPGEQGVDFLRYTTEQGLEIVMTKEYSSRTFESVFFVDTFFGVVNTNPEMNGILIFNQEAAAVDKE